MKENPAPVLDPALDDTCVFPLHTCAGGVMDVPHISDSLRCTHYLGSGGTSDVWVVRDIASESEKVRHLVAKVFRKNSQQKDRRSAERLRREIDLLTHIDDGVPRVVGHGEGFFLMEYHPGFTLKDLLVASPNRPLSFLLAVDIAVIVAGTIMKLHENTDFIHQDIKPGNLFVCDASAKHPGEVLVLDFGFAKGKNIDSNSATRISEAEGTPNYMAPEQITDATNAIAATDVFGLGVTVAQMMMGQLPFPKISDWTQLTLRVDRQSKPTLSFLTQRDPTIASFVSAMLNYDYQKRPSMREVQSFFRELSSLEEGKRALQFADITQTNGNEVPIPSFFASPWEMRCALEQEYSQLSQFSVQKGNVKAQKRKGA